MRSSCLWKKYFTKKDKFENSIQFLFMKIPWTLLQIVPDQSQPCVVFPTITIWRVMPTAHWPLTTAITGRKNGGEARNFQETPLPFYNSYNFFTYIFSKYSEKSNKYILKTSFIFNIWPFQKNFFYILAPHGRNSTPPS